MCATANVKLSPKIQANIKGVALSNLQLLQSINLGNPVAEMDQHLSDLFIPTAALAAFIDDRFDIVRGVKGSGKSALVRVIQANQQRFRPLSDVLVRVATEHTGEPAFKRAFGSLGQGKYSQAELVAAWKTYLLNLALDALEDDVLSASGKAALQFAVDQGIRYKTTSSYRKVMWSLLRFLNLKSFTLGADQIQAEFHDAPADVWNADKPIPDFPELLTLCARAFEEKGVRCWILIDRLDAAFQDSPDLERAALKALLLAYRDFQGVRYLCPKMFFRTDLFDLVTDEDGFRELSHVMARTSPPIGWDPDALQAMLMTRFAFNDAIGTRYGVKRTDVSNPDLRKSLCFSIFSDKVDYGEKKADTWTWIMNRIIDATGVRTPRDLQTLTLAAIDEQVSILMRDGDDVAEPLIGPAAIKRGLAQLSHDKIRATLLAEHPQLRDSILAFSKGKAEHDQASLEKLLGENWESITQALNRIGFIENVKESASWKIPMLYRDGLDITQGATFDKRQATE